MSSDLGDVLKRAASDPRTGPDAQAIAARGRELGRHRWGFVAAVAALLLGLGTASALISGPGGSPTTPPAGDPVETPTESPTSLPEDTVSVDGWTVRISLDPSTLGPLDAEIEKVRRAEPNNGHPWVSHEIHYTNTGEETLQFGDTRGGRFLPGNGDPVLLVGDDGCGYGIPSPGAPIKPGACANYLDIPTLKPGNTLERNITLWVELKGMTELREGTYRYEKEIEFAIGDGISKRYPMTIVFEIRRAPESGE